MAGATYVPINGAVLAWAMEQAGVDDVELAKRCKTSPDVVREWRESGREPTRTQFRQLVARLRRPASIYFLAEAPEVDAAIRAFRSPPGAAQERHLLDDELKAIATAERLQKVARWVREQRKDQPVDIPHISSATAMNDALREARAFLGWRVAEQLLASSTSEVARTLRARLESVGFLVLQFPMTPAGSRGFSLDDDLAPVIAVNSAYTTEARVFSYMHEYAHVARGLSSICSRVPETTLEHRCEDFAAAFLMPTPEFEGEVDRLLGVGKMVSSLDDVARVARRFRVSLRATAVRLEKVGRAVEDLYARVDAEADFKGGGGFARDNTAPAIRQREWGTRYPQLLFEAEQEGWLGRTDVLEYLNLSNGQLLELRGRVEAGVPVEV